MKVNIKRRKSFYFKIECIHLWKIFQFSFYKLAVNTCFGNPWINDVCECSCSDNRKRLIFMYES